MVNVAALLRIKLANVPCSVLLNTKLKHGCTQDERVHIYHYIRVATQLCQTRIENLTLAHETKHGKLYLIIFPEILIM